MGINFIYLLFTCCMIRLENKNRVIFYGNGSCCIYCRSFEFCGEYYSPSLTGISRKGKLKALKKAFRQNFY